MCDHTRSRLDTWVLVAMVTSADSILVTPTILPSDMMSEMKLRAEKLMSGQTWLRWRHRSIVIIFASKDHSFGHRETATQPTTKERGSMQSSTILISLVGSFLFG